MNYNYFTFLNIQKFKKIKINSLFLLASTM
jgi:hypothetical protein